MNSKVKLYILLTDTGTLLTRLIKLYTKAPFNHASIAFDHELKNLYSFGRKKPNNPLIAGFVKENIQSRLFRKAKCALYCLPLDKEVYEKVYEFVKTFEKNRHIYKYNLLGLLGVMAKIDVKRKNAYFCSQFVSYVLKQNGINIVDKPCVFTTPSDIGNSSLLKLLYTGKLCDYKPELFCENISSNLSNMPLSNTIA